MADILKFLVMLMHFIRVLREHNIAAFIKSHVFIVTFPGQTECMFACLKVISNVNTSQKKGIEKFAIDKFSLYIVLLTP